MHGPFYLLQEFSNVVQVEARPQSEVPRLDPEGLGRLHLTASIQTQTEKMIDRFLEGPRGLAHLRLEFGGHIVIQS